MKKSTKLLFALTAGVLLTPVISGCEGTSATNEEKVQTVFDSIIYGEFQKGLTADLDLITSIEGYEDVTITYAVSEEASAYLKVEGNKLVVTRPEYGSGDVALVKALSVTVTLGDVTLTKYFNVRVVEGIYDDGFELVSTPEVGTAYKLGMVQSAGKLYFTGVMNGYYGATSASGFNGKDVTLENAEGGYYLTFLDGSNKKYVDVQYSSDRAHINFVIADAAGLVYEYDTTYNTLVCSLLNDEGAAVKYFLGTHGTYATFGVEEYANVTDATYYPAHFFKAGENAVAPEAVTTIAGALSAADGTNCVIEGTVKSIDTAWSDQYNNISVTITDGTNDLYVFRMKTKVNVGDKIKVTGEIGSFNGEKQIAAGCTAEILESAPLPDEVTTIEAALAADVGTPLVIEGRVKSIDTAWSDQYNNISVTITDGKNELYVHRMATNVNVGDKIVVTGSVGEYNSAKQVAAGSTAEVLGTAVTTIPDAVAAEVGTPVALSVTVKSIDTAWSDSYGNISVTVTDGTNDLYVYRMRTNVNVGDKITVLGDVGEYKGAKQIAAGGVAVVES